MNGGEKKPKNQVGWCLIPPTILAREDLSSSQKLLFGRIMGLLGKNGYCYASNKWLGKQIGLSAKRVANLLTDMENKGMVRRKVIRGEDNKIVERRIFVTLFPNAEANTTPNRAYNAGGVFPKTGIGIPENGNRGIPENGKESNRDKSNREEIYNISDQVAENKNISNGSGFHPLKDSLNIERFSKTKTTKFAWQDEAVRFWKQLGLKDSPSPSWFKLFKKAHQANQRGILLSAFGATADADVRDKEKYFYKVFANKLCKN